MADSSVGFVKGDAPVLDAGATPGTGKGTGGEVGSSPTKATSVTDIIKLMSAPTKLSKEGEEYIEKVADAVRSSPHIKGEVKVTKIMGANYEARVIECEEYVTALVFAETYMPGAPELPAASVGIEDLKRNLASYGIRGELGLFLVVTKEDYAKVDYMAALITNVYVAHTSPTVRDFTAAAFTRDNYGLTDDMNVIRPYVEHTCPFATLPRMDTGIMLYQNEQVNNEVNLTGSNRPEYRRAPILAVVGYTDFVADDNAIGGFGPSQQKYIPIYVITGIFSALPTLQIAATGISLIADTMINKSAWAKQFSTFSKDKPNIGNLLTDTTTNAPFEAVDISVRNSVIKNYLTTEYPFLAVDLQFGNFVIPGLGAIVNGSAEFNKAVDDFTGGDGATQSVKSSMVTAINIDGRTRQTKTGEYVDTRSVDYLSLVRQGYSQKDVASFLRLTKQPNFRWLETRRIDPNAEMLYITYRTFLNPDFVKAICNDLSRSLKVRLDAATELDTYNIGALKSFAAAGIGDMQGFSVAANVAGFSSWTW